MSRSLRMRAALRRFSQSQSSNAVQNSVGQVGTDTSDRMTPATQVGSFSKFNTEAGKYEFNTDTGVVQIAPNRLLSNGKLAREQKALIAQDFADFANG